MSYLGVDYEFFCMSGECDPNVFKAMMAAIPVKGVHPKYFTKT